MIMKELKRQHMQSCKEALMRNGFHVDVCDTKEEVCELVNQMIKDESLVCDGGSVTLQETGVLKLLEHRRIRFRSHSDPTMTKEESDAEARKAFYADVFLTSANAITMEGEIINVDGHGNRVSAMIFGPKKVIIIAGYQKLVETEADARKRICTIAAPANSVRLHKQTPCAIVGKCQNCRSKDRICSSYVKLNYDREQRIHVILVAEEYGY